MKEFSRQSTLATLGKLYAIISMAYGDIELKICESFAKSEKMIASFSLCVLEIEKIFIENRPMLVCRRSISPNKAHKEV